MGADDLEVTVTADNLKVSDIDSPASALVLRVDDLTDAGQLLLNDVVLGTGATFTQSDIDHALLTFRPSAELQGNFKNIM